MAFPWATRAELPLALVKRAGLQLTQISQRLTVAATNGYGETIRRAKGISLVERQRTKVRKGQVDGDTGEIYPRSGKRSVKTILASVITRVAEWILSPLKAYKVAVQAAQERAHRRDSASSPVYLGKQARQHFWSSLWQAWESLCPEERYPQVA